MYSFPLKLDILFDLFILFVDNIPQYCNNLNKYNKINVLM